MSLPKIFGALFLLFSVSLSRSAYAAPILNEDEQFDILRSIDSICGDTWCEGDSNWSFDDLQCDTLTGCVLKVTMMPYDYDDNNGLSPRRFTCDLPAFTDLDAIAEVTNRGLQYTPGLYSAVSSCINELSDRYGPIFVPRDSACPSLFNANASSIAYPVAAIEGSGLYGAIETLTSLVRSKSKTDKSCTVDIKPYYRDAARCLSSKGSGEVCSIPTVQGSYEVARKAGKGGFALYIPRQAANMTPPISIRKDLSPSAELPRIELCSTSLLKQSQIVDGALSFNGASSEVAQSHFLASSGVRPSNDIRVRALEDLSILVKAHAEADPADCSFATQTIELESISCNKLKNAVFCSLPVPGAGSFQIIFDQKNASQILYNRR